MKRFYVPLRRITDKLFCRKTAFFWQHLSRIIGFCGLCLVVGILQKPAFALLPDGFIEQPVGGTWDAAVGLAFDPNGRLYVWEKAGRVWIVEDDVLLPGPFLNISEEVADWGSYGMLGFALSPNFLNNGYIYVLYAVDRHHLLNCLEPPSGIGAPVCNAQYNPTTNTFRAATIGRITRYTAIKPVGDLDYRNATSVYADSRKVLLGESIDSGIPLLDNGHGVGSLVFGADGSLIASTGDTATPHGIDVGGGSGQSAYAAQGLMDGIITQKEDVGAFRSQLIDSLDGKLLRIDPITGDGLPSNPFYDADAPRAARSRVWALGLRNPFRFSRRPETGSHNIDDGDPGAFYIGDVGHAAWEDLNVATRPGMNFGWPIFEGLTAYEDYRVVRTPNLDAPNPLFGTGGCAQQFFDFQDLIQQATLDPGASFLNPCDAS